MCPEPGETQPASLEPDLLSSVCHDLKAPLASLTMGVAFLRRATPRSDDPTSRVIDALGRASNRMSRTIGSFSDLAKIQMGELDLDVRRVALGEVMQGAFDTLLPEARADQLALTLDMDPSMGGLLLDCDRARVIQTVEQLYACLVHALSAPGGVRLSARREKAGDAARLEVEASAGESGPLGSGQRELPRPELALAKGLISLHGGSLDVGAEGRTLRLSFSMPTSSAGVARREPAKEASDGY